MDETKGGASSQHTDLFRNDPHRLAPDIDVDNPLEKMLARLSQGGGGKKSPPPGGGEGGDDQEDGMLRMSFLEHLGELRARIIRALAGFGVVFLLYISVGIQHMEPGRVGKVRQEQTEMMKSGGFIAERVILFNQRIEGIWIAEAQIPGFR